LKRIKILIGLLVMLALVVSTLVATPVLAQPPLNGDVEVDFTGPGILIIPDPMEDVGLPNNGTISGWDMKDLRLSYNVTTDTMYIGINVGLNASTILGDADGDGDPGGTSAWLAANGGTDQADLASSETAAVYFDLDQDGIWDVIAGIGNAANYSGFSVNAFAGPFYPPNNFGTALPGHTGTCSPNPDTNHPDLEFTITNWSTLPGHDASPEFCVGAMLGSLQDDGIGEDYLEYCQSPAICIEKTVDCNDDGVFLDEDWGTSGDTGHWRIVVTNCGNCTLTDVTVTDTNGQNFGPITLDPGAYETYEYDTVVNVDTTNVARAEGYDPAGMLVWDEDSATNRIEHEVGGTAFPVDKLSLLAPWAVLLGCAGIVTLLMLRKRYLA
jgi:uncharacterized repeat protein (TIGR01451 family)